ncbi:hypothetical protein ACJ41O_010002 [Fusarium nematophilum]
MDMPLPFEAGALVGMQAVVETLEEMEEAKIEEEQLYRHHDQLLGLYKQTITSRRELDEDEKEELEIHLLTVNPLNLIPPGTLSEPMSLVVEEKLEILSLRASRGWSARRIAAHLGIPVAQAQLALNPPPDSPALRAGLRPELLTRAQEKALPRFVTLSRRTRMLSWENIPIRLGWDSTEASISFALRRAGFERRRALQKPLISEEARQLRLAFAREHVNWTFDQWRNVLWCGMKVFSAAPPPGFEVTRKADEEYVPDCIVSELPAMRGQKFWAAFSGLTGKGPGILWQDAWGPVTDASVTQHIVPRLSEWLDTQPGSVQVCIPYNDTEKTLDVATAAALREVERRQMSRIQLPPASPELNPMVIAWEEMRNRHIGYLADDDDNEYHPNIQFFLTRNVQTGWERMVNPINLLRSMRRRCQAVIDADGLYTRF